MLFFVVFVICDICYICFDHKGVYPESKLGGQTNKLSRGLGGAVPPPLSPRWVRLCLDMNSIRHVWDELGRRIRKLTPTTKTAQELRELLLL